MFFRKNTFFDSKIDIIRDMLDKNNIDYEVVVLGSVLARGLNDFEENRTAYPIRKLIFNIRDERTVVVEQMLRDPEPEFDDILISRAFKALDAPLIWEIEIALP